jgi:hypothetical protein
VLQQLYQPTDPGLDQPVHQGHISEIHTPSNIELRVDYQIQLSTHEVPIFRNYVENISKWVGIPHYLRAPPPDLVIFVGLCYPHLWFWVLANARMSSLFSRLTG